MGNVICFYCKVGLPLVGKPLKELIEDELPVFCSTDCSLLFPDKGSREFEEKLKELKKLDEK